MIKIVLSPVSSSLKQPNITRRQISLDSFQGSQGQLDTDILYNYICVYETHNMYIYINIFIHTWIHTYMQTDRHR